MKKLTDNIYLDEIIGRGGMGEVYRGKIIKNNFEKVVAVKVGQNYAPADLDNLLLEEAKLAASLNHPGIIQVFDVGIAGLRTYIVMELIEGITLKQLIEKAKSKFHYFSEDFCLIVYQKIIQALTFAHQHNVVHRDVSPHNIMIDHHGNVKLLDFGIAKNESNFVIENNTDNFQGKLHYLAPDLLNGAKYQQQHDRYAAAVILYELLTLEKPYQGDDISALKKQILDKSFESIEIYRETNNQDLQRFIDLLLSGDNLLKSANEIIHFLDKLIKKKDTDLVAEINILSKNNLDITSFETKTSTKIISKKNSRSKNIISVVSAIILVLLSGLAIWYFSYFYLPAMFSQTFDVANLVILEHQKKQYPFIKQKDPNFKPVETMNPQNLDPRICGYLCYQLSAFELNLIKTPSDKSIAPKIIRQLYSVNSNVHNKSTELGNLCGKTRFCNEYLDFNHHLYLYISPPIMKGKFRQFDSNEVDNYLQEKEIYQFHPNLKNLTNPEESITSAYQNIKELKEKMSPFINDISPSDILKSTLQVHLDSLAHCKFIGDLIFASALLNNLAGGSAFKLDNYEVIFLPNHYTYKVLGQHGEIPLIEVGIHEDNSVKQVDINNLQGCHYQRSANELKSLAILKASKSN